MAGTYKDLVAWQKGIDLTDDVYQLTEKFPQKELYGLCSQLRRAAVSIPSNIAEGQARHSKLEFRHFLRNARGSLAELETQMLIAQRRAYISSAELEQFNKNADTLSRILAGLINSISKDS